MARSLMNIPRRNRETAEDPNVEREEFRVLAGRHTEGGIIYDTGDIVNSASDLLEQNVQAMPPKFQRVSDGCTDAHPREPGVRRGNKRLRAQPTFDLKNPKNNISEVAPDNNRSGLEAMTNDELIQYAKEEEIDLGTAKKKSEMIDVIMKSQSAPATSAAPAPIQATPQAPAPK